jgi:23S rRNA (pseudouridine1915-N3)-methyltransferase
MKKINIVCVGKIKEKYIADGIAEYLKRASRFASVNIIELNDYATNSAECVRKESDEILAAIRGYVIALDIFGAQKSSEEIALTLDKAFVSNPEVTFVIGGSCGYDDRVRAAADLRLSFGRATFPHQLMRLMLSEQIYRALTITAGTPYHK